MKQVFAVIAVWMLALAGCDDAEEAGATEATEQTVTVCSFDFSADVTEGTDAPYSLAGKLNLTVRDDGLMAADFKLADESTLLVTGDVEADRIRLIIWMPDGRMILGNGPLSRQLIDCSGEIEGEFVGPASDNVGHWLGRQPLELGACVRACFFEKRNPQECEFICNVLHEGRPNAIDTCIQNCNAAGSILDFEPAFQISSCEPPVVTSFFNSFVPCD